MVGALIVVLVLLWVVLPVVSIVAVLGLRRRIEALEQRIEGGALGASVPMSSAAAPKTAAQGTAGPPRPMRAPSTTPSRPRRDWESILGGSLLNRLGSVALVTAAVFLLNLTFERGWHAPVGPLLLGMGEGLLLVTWGWLLARGRDRLFGQGLVGTGLAVAFATVHVSHGVHSALGSWSALGLLLTIAFAGVALAHWLDSQPVAWLALLGGFLAPLLVRPEGGPWEVWVYVATLDGLALGLGDRRGWRWLDAVALVGTQVTWVAWAAERSPHQDAVPALLALQATYVLFLVTPLLRRWARRLPLRADDLYLWTGAAVALLLWSGWVLEHTERAGLGWIAIELSLVHLLLGVLARRALAESELARQGLLALALLFVVVAVPLELDALAVTATWTGQAAVVTWLATRARRQWLAVAALLTALLGMGHVLMVDLPRLARIESAGPRPESLLVLSTCGMVFVAAEIARRGGLGLLRSADGGGRWPLGRWLALPVAVLSVIVVAVELLAHPWLPSLPVPGPEASPGSPEWEAWRDLVRQREQWSQTALSIAWGIVGAGAVLLGAWRRWIASRWFGLVLLLVVVAKGVLLDLAGLPTVYRAAIFLAIGVLLMAVSWIYARRQRGGGPGGPPDIVPVD